MTAPSSAQPWPTLRRVAWMDVALTAPLAVPGIAHAWIGLLEGLDGALGLGTPPVRLDGLGWLMLHLAGVLGVCWNGARARTTDLLLTRIDMPARLVVSVLLLRFITMRAVTPVLSAFIVTEVVGAFVQWRALRASGD